MSLKDIFSSKDYFYHIPLEYIKVDPEFNVRTEFGDIPSLARDIATNGLTHALTVRLAEDKKSVYIVDGERRFRAITMINEKKMIDGGILDVKCSIEEKGSNETSRIIRMFSTGANSKALTELEQARVVFRLLTAHNMKIKAIAENIGRPQTYVNHLLDLHSAPTNIKEAVEENKISPTAAIKLARVPKEKRDEILKKSGKVRVKDVEKAAKGTSSEVSSKTIKGYIKRVDKFIESGINVPKWEGVKLGLQIALGIEELLQEASNTL
jgi:ParB/RepB/Spo0J family partition protein